MEKNIMYTHSEYVRYTAADNMGRLICDNYSLLPVMSRFGLKLGFGERTVRQVCDHYGVDTNTFLAVVNFMCDECCTFNDFKDTVSVPALVEYLKQSHVYYLQFMMPAIRKKLIETLDLAGNDISLLIIKFFDEYVKEVRVHMEYEDKVVFKYVENLLAGKKDADYGIRDFAERHNDIETKLTELKNIIVKYYTADRDSDALNSVLFDIYSTEEDLNQHSRVEDEMFIPLIMDLENKQKKDA